MVYINIYLKHILLQWLQFLKTLYQLSHIRLYILKEIKLGINIAIKVLPFTKIFDFLFFGIQKKFTKQNNSIFRVKHTQ